MSRLSWRPDYRAVFESLPVPVTLVDHRGIIVDINQASIDLASRAGRAISKEDRIGHPVVSFATAPVRRSRLLPMIDKAMRTGEISNFRWMHHDQDGRPFWVQFLVGPTRDNGGRSEGVALVRVDITQLVREEKRAAAQEQVREALWHMRSKDDLRNLLAILHRELAGLFPQIESCSLQLRSSDASGSWECHYLSTEGSRLVSMDMRTYAAVQTCWENQHPVYRPDLEPADPYLEVVAACASESSLSSSVRSLVDLPFTHGTLALKSDRSNAFAPEDIRFLAEFTKFLSLGFARLANLESLQHRNFVLGQEIDRRKQAQEELAASRERYRRLVEDSHSFIVFEMDPQGGYRYASPHIQAWTGIHPAEFLADRTHGAQITHPDDLPRSRRAFRLAASEGEQQEVEFRFRHRDGTYHWASEVLTPILDSSGKVESIQAVLHDVTSTKRATERMALELQLQRLRAMCLSLKSDDDWIDLVRMIDESLRVWIDCAGLSIQVITPSEGTVSEWSTGLQKEMVHTPSRPLAPERLAVLDEVMRTHEPLYCRDRHQIGFPEDLPMSIQTVLDVAFVAGAFQVRAEDEAAFSQHQIEIVKQFADVASQGYQRLEDLRAVAASEAHLRQSQKMEALGQLAGGVAHDFNNLLTIMMTCSELSLQDPRLDAFHRDNLTQILEAAQRGSQLTRQMLAFSRRQPVTPEIFDPGEALSRLTRMLGRILGEKIELVLTVGTATPRVLFDAGQLDQIIVNLAVNARDAMPHGGRLTLSTKLREIDEPQKRGPVTVRPGTYAELSVTDTGTGMSPQVLARVFEPFFTTKAVGRGTGLGLAMVLGAMKQNGGYVWVASDPGQGTCFTLYLPAAGATEDSSEDAPQMQDGREQVEPARATILVAEDDPSVHNVVVRVLRRSGYQVIAARNGAEALAQASTHKGRIDLLLSDIVMPGMDGPQLSAALQQLRPQLKVLFMSGYPRTGSNPAEQTQTFDGMLQKPFLAEDLVRAVSRLLGQ